MTDLARLDAHVNGYGTKLTGTALENADVNQDGVVDQKDVDELESKYLRGERTLTRVTVKDFVLGDLNRDGKVDVVDASMMQDAVHRGNFNSLTSESKVNADLNQDGIIDQADLNLLRRKIVGFNDTPDKVTLTDVNGDDTIDIKDVYWAKKNEHKSKSSPYSSSLQRFFTHEPSGIL